MSSEEEATAANVLSQMSQIQQITACETIDATVVVGHHCDVETSGTQASSSLLLMPSENQETATTVEVSPEVLQQVQAAFQQELPQLAAGSFVTKQDVNQDVIHEHHVQVLNDGIQCTTCSKPGKSYTCEHCGKKFNKSYNLKTHIRVHTGERPYQCEVCGHGFANLGDLKRHSRTHTGEKPFKCEFCGKVFSDFGSHKRHLRLHTGYKPFKCDQCDREFTRLDSFKNHLRLHTGDRPYKCDTCSKEFNYLTTYKRHLNIHKGEKPYACTQCEKKFTRQNYLTNHMNTHAKITTQGCQTDGLLTREEERTIDTEGQTAADNLSKMAGLETTDRSTDHRSEKSENSNKGTDSSPSATLLQQVTQVLGEMIPHSVSAELTDGAGGPHIVVQGTDQGGGEFKVSFAQQLLIAQHILNQAQIQRTGDQGDEESGPSSTVTTVSLPEITPELAEQIVNQVALQQESSAGQSQSILGQEDVQVIEVSRDHTSSNVDQQELVVEGHLLSQEQIPDQVTLQTDQIQSHDIVSEQVMDESEVVMTTVTGSTQSSQAVYVAVDPSQPDVQHYLGEIQVLQCSDSKQS